MASGWFPDQFAPGQLRWWDGAVWGARFDPRTDAALRSPVTWLPIIMCAPLMLLALIVAPIAAPQTLLALAPTLGLFTLVLWWLDRPLRLSDRSKLFALSWGALVATLVAIIVSLPLLFIFGEVAAAVYVAPLTEEITKAAVLVVLVKAGVVDRPYTALIYGLTSAIGFTVAEDVVYFASGAQEGQLPAVFIGRVLVSPFAHMLFTLPTAVAIGKAAQLRPPVRPAARMIATGLTASIVLHGAWNGSLVSLDLISPPVAVIVALVCAWLAVFVFCATYVIRLRIRTRRELPAQVTAGAQAAGLGPIFASCVLTPPPWFTAGAPKGLRRDLVGLRRDLAHIGASPPDAVCHADLLRARTAAAALSQAGIGPRREWWDLPGWYTVGANELRWFDGYQWSTG